MNHKQQNIRSSRFVGDKLNPKQPAFVMPQDSTSGQIGPKSQSSKYRWHSRQTNSSERIRHENEAPQGNNVNNSGGSSHSSPSDKKATRDGKRFEKSKFRAEKSGVKLDTAHKKMAAQKAPKKPGPVKTVGRAARFQAHYFVHSKINEAEHENVGLEAAHKTELTGERAIQGGARFVRHRIRTHPARSVSKWERRDTKTKADMQYRTLAREYPELKKNTISRFFAETAYKKALSEEGSGGGEAGC